VKLSDEAFIKISVEQTTEGIVLRESSSCGIWRI